LDVVLFEEYEAVMLVPRSVAIHANHVKEHSIGVILLLYLAVSDVAVSLTVRAYAFALC
jgi:hypothetical protein